MVYDIVDYIISRLNDTDFKSKDSVKQAALRLDKNDKIKGWMDKSSDWYTDKHKHSKYDNKPLSGTTLKDEVDDKNARYLQDKKAELGKIKTQYKLSKFTFDEDYEPTTVTDIDSAIEDKKKELEEPLIVEIDGQEFEIPVTFMRGRPKDEVSSIVQALTGETLESIMSATTQEELNDIEIPDNIPKTMKKFLMSELKSARKELL